MTTDGAVRQSRASRARDASTNAAFAPKRRGDVLPNRSGRPRATGRAASRARVRIRRADVTATGPPGLNIAGVFFRERRQRSGLTLGCATFTPLKVVARRERAARALGAAARGARIATGATMAAMITAVLLDVIHIRRFPELFPRRIFCRAQPLPKNKIRDCSPIRSRQRTHAVRRESALRLVRQSQNLPTRLASCHTNRNAEGPTGERFGNRRFASIHRWIRSVGRVGPRPRFCQTEAHRAFQTPWRGSWCACAARGPWLAMGVLAFGDPSTWASKVESEASRARASSRADAGRVSGERQQSHRHRVVSLRGGGGGGSASPGASSARGARGGPTAPTSPSIPSDPNFAPRAAWPEGTFTITYPRGYDPERRRFVDGDATNVTVEKLPAAKRAALEAERKAREEAAARAAKAAEEAS